MTPKPSLTVRSGIALLIPMENDEVKAANTTLLQTNDRDNLFDLRIFSALAEGGTVQVNIMLSSAEEEVTIGLPHKKTEEIDELLKTLYLLEGWNGIDTVYERVQRSLIAAVVEILALPKDEVNAITYLVPSSSPHPLYIPPDHTDLTAEALGKLIEIAKARKWPWPRVLAGLKAVTPVNGLFSMDTPHASTRLEFAANPEVAAHLYSDVLIALQLGRRRLVSRVIKSLRRVEKEAQRLIGGGLTDTRTTIISETLRYFSFIGKDGAQQALSSKISSFRFKKTDSLHENESMQPEDLKESLKQLVPFAQEVLRLMELRTGGPSTVKFIDSHLLPKRAAFARELGRHAQKCPVISQIKLEEVEVAYNAGNAKLGYFLFSILKRAYSANEAMRLRVEQFKNAVEGIHLRRFPEKELASSIRNLGKRSTVWGYPKYIERATARIISIEDDIGRKAVNDVLDESQGLSDHVAREMSQAAVEAMAIGAAAHFTTRMVPVLNVALAAWHISAAIEDFKDQENEFYCSLDPRDALIEAKPSFTGLMFNVTTEAAFAFI